MYRYVRSGAGAPFGESFVAGDNSVTHYPRPLVVHSLHDLNYAARSEAACAEFKELVRILK